MDETTTYRQKIDPTHKDYEIEEWPFYNLARVVGHYHQRLDATLKPAGLDVARWRVLSILARYKCATVTQIAHHAVAKMSTIAKIIQRMTAQGLIQTRPSADDARATEVLLTPEGETLLATIRVKVSAIGRQSFYDISDSDLQQLNRVCRTIYTNLTP